MASRRTVGDYVTLQRGTTYKGSLVGKPGPALLGLGSIQTGGGFRDGDYKTYGGECPEKLMLVPGDLFASLKGATKDGEMIGSVARVPTSVPSGRLTQDTVKLIFHEANEDAANYLYWLLRTPQYRTYCAARAMGSAVVALSRNDFLAYPVPPVTPTRMQLVNLFEALERKIELNRQMNETLESIARALFKSWFVDFDPVRAKAEGRDLVLPAQIDRLFPDSLVYVEKNEIPSGWQLKPIGELATVCGGSTPSTKEPSYWEGSTHCWATPKDLSALNTPVLLDTERKITDLGLRQIGSGLLPAGTVLMSSRAPIGYLAIAEVPVAINQGFIAMKAVPGMSNLFLLRWAEWAHEIIVSQSNGSTFLEISKSSFRPILVTTPPSALMREYDRLARPLYQRMVCNEIASRTLAQLRDALSPRLISGELRIPDVERIVRGQL